jgi:hypothetical protein
MSEHDVNMFQALYGEDIWDSRSDACGWCMGKGSCKVVAAVIVHNACH